MDRRHVQDQSGNNVHPRSRTGPVQNIMYTRGRVHVKPGTGGSKKDMFLFCLVLFLSCLGRVGFKVGHSGSNEDM